MRIMASLLFAALLVGCGDDDGGGGVDAPPGIDAPRTPDAPLGPDAPPGGCTGELSAFVIDLVENHTRDDNQPAAIDDCTFTDAQDPAAFDSLFP